MQTTVSHGSFRLKGAALLKLDGKRVFANKHRLSLEAGVPYPTIQEWVDSPETVKTLHLKSLKRVLIDAYEMTPRQALSLRLGDLLEFTGDDAE